MISLTTFKWDTLGLAWNPAHTPTLNEMSGLCTVKNNRLPIMLQYLYVQQVFRYHL